MRPWGCSRISGPAGSSRPGVCLGRLCPVCDRGAVAGLVLWQRGQPPRGVVLGTSGWPPGHGAPPGGTRCRGPGARAAARAAGGRASGLAVGLGADGVMVPFRPEAGAPTGRSAGAKSKWACWPAWASIAHGQGRSSRGCRSAGWWPSWGISRPSRRVSGSKRCARDRTLPRWSGSVMVAEGCGACLRSASRAMPGHLGLLSCRATAVEGCGRLVGWADHPGPPVVWLGTAPPAARHARRGLGRLAEAWTWRGCLRTARDTLRTVYAYLDRHREHIDYAIYKDLGLPLGSGMVESACKWLIQQRFKGVGMRWSEDGFNHLLHLRLAWVNGRFEALFGLALSPNS